MESFDTIVIGSGAGGLAAALCLARAGQKVVVLEQHYVPGGWCHSFFIQGQRFSPGVHYIGLVEKGGSTSALYEGLGIANDLVFFRMNPKAYEHCWIGDERIDMPAGFDALCDSLSQKFPHEKKGIKKYLNTVREVSRQLQLIPKMNGFWDNVTIPFRTAQLGKYGLFSLKKVINWHVKDPLLQKVLNVQCGDHGLPPGKASFPLHCAVMDHYFDGAYYPMGGGGGIVKALTKAIKKHGGEIRTGVGVKRILTEGNEKYSAVGVELADGQLLKAKRIVSNADPSKTYLDLVGKEKLSKKLNEKLAKTKYSVTSLILFLTVDMDVKAAGMDSGNVWVFKNQDMDLTFEEMTAKDITTADEFPALFLSCTTLKDPVSFNGNYHSFEIVPFIDYAPFLSFEKEETERTPAYLAFKERICNKFMASMEKILPGVKDHVVLMELGTPITNGFYINSTNGNVYGTEKSLTQIGPFAFGAQSEIENLYLCGASTMSHGVAGSSMSGVETAAKILKCRAEELIVPLPDQQVRIYDADDDANWPQWIHQKMEDKKRAFKGTQEKGVE